MHRQCGSNTKTWRSPNWELIARILRVGLLKAALPAGNAVICAYLAHTARYVMLGVVLPLLFCLNLHQISPFVGFGLAQLIMHNPSWLKLSALPGGGQQQHHQLAGSNSSSSYVQATDASHHAQAAKHLPNSTSHSGDAVPINTQAQAAVKREQSIDAVQGADAIAMDQGCSYCRLLTSPSWDLPTWTHMWQQRSISNLQYLLVVNYYAGRRLGDRAAHAMVPWVIDFSQQPTDMEGKIAAVFLPSIKNFSQQQ